jgi:uncharacterized protein (DUF433 family)
MSLTTTKHIESRDGVCGGKPCVTGTRIRVWDIHVWHDLRGQSPEEIVALYPQLSLADVHAALAYYLDHRETIEQQAEKERAEVAQMEAAQEPSRFAKLRDELLKGNDGNGDSISSG